MKTAIQVVLAVAIIALGYLLWESIQKPIRFNKEKDRIEQATIQRLKDIRTAQLAFRSEFGQFTGDFDSLITFLKTDSFSVVQAIGSVPDSMIEELGSRKKAELQALKEGVAKQVSGGAYLKGLEQLAELRPAVDTFFDEVMVMVDDAALQNNRLALLDQLLQSFRLVADFSRIKS